MTTWRERIRSMILGDTIRELREENRQLREHLLKLSGYLQPQIDALAPHMPIEDLKQVSELKLKPRKRSMSWPQWARAEEARLARERLRDRVAGKRTDA